MVARAAAAAATDDPRFPPVGVDEVRSLSIEVSVLGPTSPCSGPEVVVVGRHGLVVEWGAAYGLLLPQVAVEQGWDAAAFVEGVCRKASLPPDAWRRGGRLLTFEAEVFAE